MGGESAGVVCCAPVTGPGSGRGRKKLLADIKCHTDPANTFLSLFVSRLLDVFFKFHRLWWGGRATSDGRILTRPGLVCLPLLPSSPGPRLSIALSLVPTQTQSVCWREPREPVKRTGGWACLPVAVSVRAPPGSGFVRGRSWPVHSERGGVLERVSSERVGSAARRPTREAGQVAPFLARVMSIAAVRRELVLQDAGEISAGRAAEGPKKNSRGPPC